MRLRFFLLLLLLPLCGPVCGQAAAQPAPDDLVVTAEIVGYSYKTMEGPEAKSRLILYVRVKVRNQTNYPREVTLWTCSWDDSWIHKGEYSFCGWGCDKNFTMPMTIPAGQSVVFYGPLCRLHENGNEATSFALGFVDYTEADFWSNIFRKRNKRWNKLLKSRSIYWSNELNGNIDPATTPEITGSDRYNGYYLSEAGK